MPRHFFHRTDGAFDHVGVELPDLAGERLEAVGFAAETVKDYLHKVWEGGTFRVEVSDSDPRLLCTVIVLAIDAPAARGVGLPRTDEPPSA